MRNSISWYAYALPIAVFLIVSSFETSFGAAIYPVIYTAKIAAVATILAIAANRSSYPELHSTWRYVPSALLLGITLCVVWIGVDHITPHFAALGGRAGFDPWSAIHNPTLRWTFILVRFLGLVALAPVMEELFFRSFVLRVVIDPDDFRRVQIGRYELTSCIAVVILMALGHPEWLSAAIFSLSMNLLIYRTKNLFACILTHGVTNLALGLYIIATHSWRYW